MMETMSLIGSRELARRLKPLGLTLPAFARLDGAPRPILRIGQRGLRWSADQVNFWIGQRWEEARREAVRQAAWEALS